MTKPAILLINGDVKHLFFNPRPVYITNCCFKDAIYMKMTYQNTQKDPFEWSLWIT
jgi:hypothetical protein